MWRRNIFVSSWHKVVQSIFEIPECFFHRDEENNQFSSKQFSLISTPFLSPLTYEKHKKCHIIWKTGLMKKTTMDRADETFDLICDTCHCVHACARTRAEKHARIWCSCVHTRAHSMMLCISRGSSGPPDIFAYRQKRFFSKYMVTRCPKGNFL